MAAEKMWYDEKAFSKVLAGKGLALPSGLLSGLRLHCSKVAVRVACKPLAAVADVVVDLRKLS